MSQSLYLFLIFMLFVMIWILTSFFLFITRLQKSGLCPPNCYVTYGGRVLADDGDNVDRDTTLHVRGRLLGGMDTDSDDDDDAPHETPVKIAMQTLQLVNTIDYQKTSLSSHLRPLLLNAIPRPECRFHCERHVVRRATQAAG
jgi:hypothetical protein